MYLWNSTIESKGKYLLMSVSLRLHHKFLHMVTNKAEYVNIIADAAPLVTVTPYPAILLKPPCSASTE